MIKWKWSQLTQEEKERVKENYKVIYYRCIAVIITVIIIGYFVYISSNV